MLSHSTQKWIAPAFRADCGSGAVARHNLCLVWKREQAGVNRIENLWGIAAGQVGAANAARKQRVAGNEHVERDKMEADGTLGVARGVDHPGRIAVETDELTIGKRLIGRCGFGSRDAEPVGLRLHDLDLFEIVLVEKDGRARKALEFQRASHVVDVSVRNKNLLELEAELGEAALNAADFVAGVNDDGFVGLLVTQNGAVALQRADWEGFEDHGSYFRLDG